MSYVVDENLIEETTADLADLSPLDDEYVDKPAIYASIYDILKDEAENWLKEYERIYDTYAEGKQEKHLRKISYHARDVAKNIGKILLANSSLRYIDDAVFRDLQQTIQDNIVGLRIDGFENYKTEMTMEKL